MKNKKNVVLIGSGNVAHALARSLSKHYRIIQVYSPTPAHAKTLAGKYKASFTDNIYEIDYTASLYIIAVKDDAISTLADKLSLPGKLVVHTSGSVDISALRNISSTYGVLYPLQTFMKNEDVTLKDTPLCIEGSGKKTLTEIRKIAATLSDKVVPLSSEQRRTVHLAAVIANNFSNHFFAVAEEILAGKKLPRKLLLPLIRKTVDQLDHASAKSLQTGPARRNDKKTIEAHLAMLKTDKELQKIYRAMSGHIQATYYKKD